METRELKTSSGKLAPDSARAGDLLTHDRRLNTRAEQLGVAMSLMREALAILDQSNDAASSSVHLDLAIERLRELT